LDQSAEWESRYEAAIVASGQVLYDWRAGSDRVQYRGACETILGYSAEDLATNLGSWRVRMHPDDVERFEVAMRDALAAKRPFRFTYRVRRKDEKYVVIENSGHFMLDEAGEIVRMIGFLSDVTERTEQSITSSALARGGRELISSLETPVVLERLCRLTTEVLDCDFSSTWLVKPERGVYAAIAGYGLGSEQWDSVRLLELPADPATPLLTHLLHEDLAQVTCHSTEFPLVSTLLGHYDVGVVLCVALRRGGTIAGIHSAGYRHRDAAFTPMQERIARGIAHLASMALTNAMLFEELERAGRLKSEFV
jgi:PAS domain S-box-containing protein